MEETGWCLSVNYAGSSHLKKKPLRGGFGYYSGYYYGSGHLFCFLPGVLDRIVNSGCRLGVRFLKDMRINVQRRACPGVPQASGNFSGVNMLFNQN